jgi:hypothetical protein
VVNLEMRRVGFIIFSGFLLRFILAAWTGIQGPSVGLQLDAQTFYFRMAMVARSGLFESMGVGEGLLINSYGLAMYVLGDHVFVSCFMSCLVWWAAGFFFSASLTVLEIDSKASATAAMLFAFWPTAVQYTSIPLREPLQLMFVNMGLLGALGLTIKRRPLALILLLAGSAGAGLLHGGLVAFAFVLVGATMLIYPIARGRRISLLGISLGLLLFITITYVGYNMFSGIGYDVSGGVLESVQSYQEGGLATTARSDYKVEAQVFDLASALFAVPFGLFQYLFEPMPWRASTAADVVLLLENVIRLLIVAYAITVWRREVRMIDKTLVFYLLGIYLVQEMIWSLGTVNWGTASRHHVPSMGILLILAASLLNMRKRYFGIYAIPINYLR